MATYYDDIEYATLHNNNYRKVVNTIPDSMQLVLMSLLPGEEIGMEVHPHTTQFFRIEKGMGIADIGGKLYILNDGISIIVPPGVYHNIRNISGTEKLKLYTIYTPPEHHPGTIERLQK